MKRLFYLAGCLLLAGTLSWSCSDDGGDDIGDDIVDTPSTGPGTEDSGNGSESSGIVLDSETETDQVVFADDEDAADEGIKFTTQGPWTAEVEDITSKSDASTVDWLILSQYSGDAAGDYTITITLKQNFTGSSRKAEIRIICDDTVITITVEQKAEKEDGVKMKRVKSVAIAVAYGAGYTEVNGDSGDTDTYTYSYDEQGRVARVVEQGVSASIFSDTESETNTYTFDYHIMGEITITQATEGYYGDDSATYLLTLNDYGNVVNIHGSDDYDYYDTKVGYTEDGRLGKMSYEGDGEDWYQTYYYTDGLLTKFESKYEYDDSPDVQEFSVDVLYPNRYPATGTNIDLNGFTFIVGEHDIDEILYQIGLLGKGSDCLMEIGGYSDYDEYASSAASGYPTPGEIITVTGTTIQWPEEESALPLTYEFDGDNYVTKFSYEDPYEVYEYSYEIHVGTELMYPDYPEAGYDWTIENYTTTKVGDEKNTYTYTVTYE